jgi:hypothetical protein
MLDKLTAPAEETAQETTEAWLAAFGAALTRGDARALADLFVSDSHWRNLFGLSWHFATFTAGAFSQARIYSRYIALQIDAIEHGRLAKNIETRD